MVPLKEVLSVEQEGDGRAADLDWKQKLTLEGQQSGKGAMRHDKAWKQLCVPIGKKKRICYINVTTNIHVVEVSAYFTKHSFKEAHLCVCVCVLNIRSSH